MHLTLSVSETRSLNYCTGSQRERRNSQVATVRGAPVTQRPADGRVCINVIWDGQDVSLDAIMEHEWAA